MLGKLIKNEFVNRWKTVAFIMAAMLGLSVIQLVVSKFDGNSLACDTLQTTIMILFGMAFFASIVLIFLLPMMDFQKRFFKDQGYLTHTLPVKTGAMIFARIICDAVMVAAVVIVYPFFMCVAEGDFSVYKQMINDIEAILCKEQNVADKALVITFFVLIVLAFFLGSLFVIWQFNAAYAIGHSFSSAKKAMSVVSYIVLFIIFEIIVYVVRAILSTDVMTHAMTSLFGNLSGYTANCVFMLAVDLAELIGVLIVSSLTGYVCKYHLNLE